MASMSETISENRFVFLKLLGYSLLMLFLPIGTYYFLLYIIWGGDQNMAAWAGIGGVCMCNFVIAAYAIMAWSDPPDEADVEYIYLDDEDDEDDESETSIRVLNENYNLRQRKIAEFATTKSNTPSPRDKAFRKGNDH